MGYAANDGINPLPAAFEIVQPTICGLAYRTLMAACNLRPILVWWFESLIVAAIGFPNLDQNHRLLVSFDEVAHTSKPQIERFDSGHRDETRRCRPGRCHQEQIPDLIAAIPTPEPFRDRGIVRAGGAAIAADPSASFWPTHAANDRALGESLTRHHAPPPIVPVVACR
jgi:hypothetical protein